MDTIRDAYYAGLLDGEGCFYIHHKHKSAKTRERFDPVIMVGMTHEETVRSILEHFKVGSVAVKVKQRKGSERWKQQWRWTVCNRQALDVALRLLPYLITKRDDAQKIVDHYSK